MRTLAEDYYRGLEMRYQRDLQRDAMQEAAMQQNRVLIVVEGGFVRGVFTTDGDLKAEVVDLDSMEIYAHEIPEVGQHTIDTVLHEALKDGCADCR